MDYMESKLWRVGTAIYGLDRELFLTTYYIVVRRINRPFDKAITIARAQRAANEFSSPITIELTENLIGLRGTKVNTLEGACQVLDEFMSTLDRIVTGREAGVRL